MGVEYDLVSDTSREGYELGKGPWSTEEFLQALHNVDANAISDLMLKEGWSEIHRGYCERVAADVIAFVSVYPDWRLIDDGSSDITVVDVDEWCELVDQGCDPDDSEFTLYRRVGSRYRQ